jgi:hypothetical protein
LFLNRNSCFRFFFVIITKKPMEQVSIISMLKHNYNWIFIRIMSLKHWWYVSLNNKNNYMSVILLKQLKWILFDRLCKISFFFQNKEFHLFDFYRNVKRDDRSIFLYAYENSETFSSVELQIYFSSAERRTA